MRITIGGLPGSGTTTIAKMLVEKYNLERVNGGVIWDQMAEERNTDVFGLNKIAETDESIDLELDGRLVEIAKNNDDIIMESRLIGQFCHQKNIPAFKIWLDATLEVRTKRLKEAGRADEKTKEREESEKKRYKELYNIDIDDLSVYDLLVDTNEKSPQEIVEIISNSLSKSEQEE